MFVEKYQFNNHSNILFPLYTQKMSYGKFSAQTHIDIKIFNGSQHKESVRYRKTHRSQPQNVITV